MRLNIKSPTIRDKLMLRNNLTLDRFVVKRQEKMQPGISKAKIKVPPSSGLQPESVPKDVVLRYPLKPEFRQYQQQIVSKCVCMNTLVCLPTGLGKTHIAAVLIANFVRWFPQQKIIFMAPTRPLVRQQVSALRNLRDQVSSQMVVEITGNLPPSKRRQLYDKHKVIFATPQTIYNDIRQTHLDGKKIILIIIDQCHKAVGNFAYATILQHMNHLNVAFRVVGLSATPGSEQQKIQEVIRNINIAGMVYKDQQDPDVKKYLHDKIINQVNIRQNDIIKQALECLDKFGTTSLGMLVKLKLIQPWIATKGLNTSFFLIRTKFSERIQEVEKQYKSMAYAALKILYFLISSRKALVEQGYQSFRIRFFSQLQLTVSSQSLSHLNREQVQADDLQQLFEFFDQLKSNGLPKRFRQSVLKTKQYEKLCKIFNIHSKSNQLQSSCFLHPKLQKLVQILTQFFSKNTGKAIVFTQFRLTAKQIKDYIQKRSQIIKSQLFFGQSKTVFKQSQDSNQSTVLQLKQKQQIQLIDRYKQGLINTLISTSIGQQGLDIGQVDCIVCYDGGHSPIRGIQRRGRTGRKRTGYVYIMLMEGKELEDYQKGMKKEKKMKDILRKGNSKFQFYGYNSSLFEENSVIPIQLYQNQINLESSVKKTKNKAQSGGVKQKKTRKTKKTKKSSGQQQKNEQELFSNTNYQISVTQESGSGYQFSIPTLASVVGKYIDYDQNSQSFIETKSQQKQKQKQQQSNRYSFSNHQQTQLSIQFDSIVQISNQQGHYSQQQGQFSLNKQNQKYEQIKLTQEAQQQFQQMVDSDEEQFAVLKQFLDKKKRNQKTKQQKQQQVKESSQGSISSDQLLDILSNFKSKFSRNS